MSIADKITSIETHIGDIYDTLEVGGADLTNVNKNIVNIKSQLKDRYLDYMNNGTQEIWNNWEKVTGDGTSLTLNNTEQAPIKMDLKGNTSQTGTPTPSSPIPVNVVSGDNVITISNQGGTDSNTYNIDLPVENLFNKDKTPDNYYYNSSGTTTVDGTNKFINQELPLSNKYTISWESKVNSGGFTSYVRIVEYNSSNTFIKRTLIGNNNTTITLDNNTTKVISCVDAGPYAYFEELQIEKGSKFNPYTPYGTTPIELCKIGNYQDKFIKNKGKNLFDESYYNDTTLYTQQTPYFASLKLPDSFKTKFYGNMNLKGTSQSLVFGFSNSINSVSTRMLSGGTITNNVEYDFTNATDVYLVIGNSSGINISTDVPKIFNNYDIMISKTSGEPYEPYGNGNWYLHKEIGKVVLNGTQTITGVNTTQTNTTRVNYAGLATNFTNVYQLFSNQLTYSNNFSTDVEGIGYDTSNGALWFRINKSIVGTTENDVNNYLGNKNLIIYHIYKTPTNTEITYQPLIEQLNLLEKAQSKENQTNISQVNNDLPFIISASALKEWSV